MLNITREVSLTEVYCPLFILENILVAGICLDDTYFICSSCLYFIYCVNQKDVNKDDDKLFESFFIKDLPPQCTLVDIIFKKFKDNESRLAEGLMMIHISVLLLTIVYCWITLLIVKLVSFFHKSVLILKWTL